MKLSLNSNFHHTKKHCANNALHWDYFMTFRKSHWWTLFYEILRGGLFCFSPTSSEQWTLAARKKGQTVARYAYLHHHHHHQSSALRMQVWEKSLMQLLSNGEVHTSLNTFVQHVLESKVMMIVWYSWHTWPSPQIHILTKTVIF